MLPDESLSLSVQQADYLSPRDQRGAASTLVDYERGGTAVGNASAGLNVQDWTMSYNAGTNRFMLASEAAPTPVAIGPTVADVVNFGFTFDQNMRVFIAYELENGNAFYYWFDTVGSAFTTTQLPVGSRSPRCSLDDKRALEVGSSDIILCYLRDDALYFRAQRDRYLVEYTLTTELSETLTLVQVGQSKVNRFQFSLLETV